MLVMTVDMQSPWKQGISRITCCYHHGYLVCIQYRTRRQRAHPWHLPILCLLFSPFVELGVSCCCINTLLALQAYLVAPCLLSICICQIEDVRCNCCHQALPANSAACSCIRTACVAKVCMCGKNNQKQFQKQNDLSMLTGTQIVYCSLYGSGR